MTDDRDFDRIARAWLELGPNEAPDRAVSAVLKAVATTPQVRPLSQRLLWRLPTMTRFPITAAAAVAIVIVVGGGALLMLFDGSSGAGGPSTSASPFAEASPTISPSPTAAASLTLPDPVPVEPEAIVAVEKPIGTAFDGQAVWILTEAGGLVRIDPATNQADPPVVLDDGPYLYNGVSADATGLWATRWSPGLVYHLDPATHQILARIETEYPKGVLAIDGAVWVANTHTGTVTRIDPATNEIVASITVGSTGTSGPNWLTSGFGSIWTGIPRDASIVRIDPATNEIQATIPAPVTATPCGKVVVGADAVWITSCASTTFVTRIDPATNTASAIETGGDTWGIEIVDGAPWVPIDRRSDSDLIVRIDPGSNQIDRALTPGPGFVGGGDMVVGAGSVWVVDGANNQVLRLPLAAFAS